MGKQIDARDWIFQVSDGQATPTWMEIMELTEFSHNPAENEESADTTVFGSKGKHSSQAMQRGATLELTGRWAYTDDGSARDPGQLRVEAMADKVSDASLTQFRFRHVSQAEWVVWTAWFSLGEQGGGNNAKTGWATTVHRSGASTTATAA